jgi:ADP-heptose:LPS heptosyltransferase
MSTIFWTLLTALCSPFLFVWSLRPRNLNRRRKILIIQWAKLGDMVATTPMFRAIKESKPEWEVHVLCRKQSAVVLENNPFIDRVIVGGKRSKMIQELSREGYDAVINCLPGAFFSLLGLWCGARHRINTFSTFHGHIIRWSRVFNAHNVEFKLGRSIFAHYMSLLEPLGIPSIPYRLDFFPSKEDQHVIGAWMHARGLNKQSFIIFNVSAGNTIKEWPLENFVALADQIIERHHLPVVISTLDQEKVRQIFSAVHDHSQIVDGSNLSLGEFGALCAHAAVFVAVDTGPTFIAHAMGAPVVVLVGGSDPREQIPPAGPKVIHVLPSPGCEPWMHVTLSPKKATPQQLRCVQETSVEAVKDALGQVL